MTAPASPARRGQTPATPLEKRYGHQAAAERSAPAARIKARLRERSAAELAELARVPDLWNPPAPAEHVSPGNLDTLAQLGQRPNLLKRARARYMTTPLAVSLAELRGRLERGYRNTVYCCSTLEQAGGKLTGKYCGNRWCLVCNRIRTARAWNRYMPVFEEWAGKHFVTLTIKNVPAELLPDAIREMIREFQAIKRAMRRTAGVKLRALRKLECTYNARTDEYHPHFHFVVEDREQALLLREAWLARFPDTTDAKGQDVQPADSQSVRELFKYFTKLLAKKKRRDGTMGAVPVPPAALDVIFRAMQGLRVYQPCGFKVVSDKPDENAEIAPEEATAAISRADETISWEWDQGASDWVDGSTGECLTGYDPAEGFKEFVSSMSKPSTGASSPP